jgi:murein DD-endopeptidase MepM/ murein hydrolase activator NlpD
LPDTPRAPRRRDARRVYFLIEPRPALLVLALVAGSIATWTLSAGEGAAGPPSTPSPVSADVFRELTTSSPTPDEGTPAPLFAVSHEGSRLPLETVAPTPWPEPPAVVRFRPRHGWTDVARTAELSVRFTKAMDHASTEEAFAALIDGTRIAGTYRWAEGDTVLVLRPATALPYGSRVTLAVAGTASSADHLSLGAARSVAFTVEPKPAPKPVPRPAPAPRAPAPSSSGWQWPLLGPITQRFGESLTVYGYHEGLDINGETGDPVRAARSGRVTVAGHWDECGGIQVQIDHGAGVESWYRHLSRVDVAVGATVTAGTVIGRVGETGCAFGSHLHFAIRVNKTFVDPLRYLPPR